jgi:NitT/TauT family transport system ATP-binding protein
MAELVATNVSKIYRSRNREDVVAIDDLSLTVRDGEFVSIVGPSGCGKSTFLKIADGLIGPSSGEVLVAGRPASERGSQRAMVFQDSSLLPWYTVLRNVAYGLECLGVGRDQRRKTAQRFVDLVGLRGFEDHYPHELSGGMQQRVNLARALSIDPEVLLMDEPFAALDPQTREMMQSELLEIWTPGGKTVLFVTHAISEAVYLSDRVIVMSARPGRIIADIPIDIPRPRPFEDKRSPAYLRYEDQIWGLLQGEVRRTVEEQMAVAR